MINASGPCFISASPTGEHDVAGHAPNHGTGEVLLRDVEEADLPIFFDQQLDPDANHMAAFTARNPADRAAFMEHWARILGDETITKRTILVDGQVAGNVESFEQFGEREVGYWLGKDFWGKGIATKALSAFLGHVQARPLYGHVAKHNIASMRVLEKCGFTIGGEDSGSSSAVGDGVEEFLLRLSADECDEAPRPHPYPFV